MKRTFTILLFALFLFITACSGNLTPASEPTEVPQVEQESESPPTEMAPTPTEPASSSDPGYPAPSEQAYPAPDDAETQSNQEAYPAPETPIGRTFVIVPEESQASYTVEEEFFSNAVTNLGKELGFFTTIGATDNVTGFITLDPDSFSTIITGEFSVHIVSLVSDDNRRDNRIRDEFLESRKFPDAVFIPLSIEGLSDDYQEGQVVTFQLSGTLTIRDETQPVTFDVTAKLEGGTLTGIATSTILMTDFGFDPPEIIGFMRAENEALITLQFVARE